MLQYVIRCVIVHFYSLICSLIYRHLKFNDHKRLFLSQFFFQIYFRLFYRQLANDYGWAIITRTMWSPVIFLRANEHQTGWCRIRTKLWQKTKLQKVDGPEGERSCIRDVRQGGHRLRFGSQISPSDVYLFLQPHGIRKLHGLLSGEFVHSGL